ncbi:hypothetical protein BBSC_0580 [Bifidobacterium scardovii JCM 12489 = DSM 13734]|nr:hypothetical protein BBSC_0580 [Bifidobacterium scardovii JCM 12489 = DSM 13734]
MVLRPGPRPAPRLTVPGIRSERAAEGTGPGRRRAILRRTAAHRPIPRRTAAHRVTVHRVTVHRTATRRTGAERTGTGRAVEQAALPAKHTRLPLYQQPQHAGSQQGRRPAGTGHRHADHQQHQAPGAVPVRFPRKQPLAQYRPVPVVRQHKPRECVE